MASTYKTANILTKLLKLSHSKAKQALHKIWQADAKEYVKKAFDMFIQTNEIEIKLDLT